MGLIENLTGLAGENKLMTFLVKASLGFESYALVMFVVERCVAGGLR